MVIGTEEKKVIEFLEKNDINFIHQYVVDVPFNSTHKHKADFYLPDKDLIIEVKGYMTLHAVNKLKWFLYNTDYNYFIMQMTEEDWMGKYIREYHRSMSNKRQLNFEQQCEDILKLSASELNELSKQRLQEYEDLRACDISEWVKINDSLKV